MSTQPDPREGICSLLLLLAIPAEEKGLKQAAQARGLPFVKVGARESRLAVDNYTMFVRSKMQAMTWCSGVRSQKPPSSWRETL